MPFNGSGVYSAPALPGSFNPAVSGQSATPTDWNTLLTDISTALSTVICRDGQSVVSANISLNSHKLLLVSNATLSTDAVNAGQISSGLITGVADTGAADAYVIAPAIAITAYATYQRFQFVAAHANTGASTLAVSGLATKSITYPNAAALAANAILAGAICDVQYDGTRFILLAGGTNVVAASQAEQETGTSVVKAVTPGRQQNHPSACKAWAYVNGSTGAVLAGYNVTSVAHPGTGAYTVTLTTAFSSTNFAVLVDPLDITATLVAGFVITNSSTIGVTIGTGGVGTDAFFSIACFGDQ